MILKIFLLLISIGLYTLGNAQTADCEELMSSEALLNSSEVNSKPKEILQKYYQLLSCSNLDSEDSLILSQPSLIGSLVVEWKASGEIKTNSDLADKIEAFVASDPYLKNKELYVKLIKTSMKPVTKELFQTKDEGLDMLLFYQEYDKAELEEFVTENNLWGKTVEEVLEAHAEVYIRESAFISHFIKSPDSLFNYTDLKHITKHADKPTLLYFTGHALVNGRKMEEVVFNKIGADTLFTKFNCYAVYLDDRSKTPEGFAENHGKFETTGDYWTAIQKDHFETDKQPYFVILNHKMHTVEGISYTLETQAFIQFLESGLSKY